MPLEWVIPKIEEDKKKLLDAVAAHGAAGRQAFEDAKAAQAAQQTQATQTALSEATTRGAPQAALDEISKRLSSAYAPGQAHADRLAANFGTTMLGIGSRGAKHLERVEFETPTMGDKIQAEIDAELAEGGGGGGRRGGGGRGGRGGGRGGGGGGGGFSEMFPELYDLYDQFSGKTNLKDFIKGEAEGLVMETPLGDARLPRWEARRRTAESMGVPAVVAAGWFPKVKGEGPGFTGIDPIKALSDRNGREMARIAKAAVKRNWSREKLQAAFEKPGYRSQKRTASLLMAVYGGKLKKK